MIFDQIHSYTKSLIKPRNELLTEMEQFAVEENIPIMDLVSLEVMLQILAIAKAKKIVEIGTAIGYSAMRMALSLSSSEITSIERDEERLLKARYFIQKGQLTERITLIFGNALEVSDEVRKHGPFDCLFIDAAKGQYSRFFEMYSSLVKEGGLIISDNVLHKGMVASGEPIAKSSRTMIRNLRSFNEQLMSSEEYHSTLYPIGDGILVSKKK